METAILDWSKMRRSRERPRQAQRRMGVSRHPYAGCYRIRKSGRHERCGVDGTIRRDAGTD